MQDLPLDTLLIIGLVIASFIGKLTKKKSSVPQSNSKKKEFGREDSKGESASLEDVLKEAWQNFSNPSQVDSSPPYSPESPPPLPVQIEKKEEKVLAKKVTPSASNRNEEPVFSYSQEVQKRESFFSVTEDLKMSNKSLRKAFILKEILDQPVSIKKSSF
jgi:hypothetical protein